MGLDIHVYTKVQRVAAEVEKAILEHPEGPGEGAYEVGCRFPDINPDFPGREEGIEAVPYKYDGDWHFRAGSYSGHSRFRQQLCNALELGDFRVWIQAQTADTHGPFEEFLNFSDCDGVIGPVVSAKLAKDFAEFESKIRIYAGELTVQSLTHQGFDDASARKLAAEVDLGGDGFYSGSEFWATYQNWKKAFTDAAGNGFVAFS